MVRRNIWDDRRLVLRLMVEGSATRECCTMISGARVHICWRVPVAIDVLRTWDFGGLRDIPLSASGPVCVVPVASGVLYVPAWSVPKGC
jgi:hypothetical protein